MLSSWQVVQGWCDVNLRATSSRAGCIFEDFRDGATLIELVHALSRFRIKITDFNERPSSKAQRLENLLKVMRALRAEGIPEEITPELLEAGDRSACVDLIRALVLRFQVSRVLVTSLIADRLSRFVWSR